MRPVVTVVGSHPVSHEPTLKDHLLEKLRRRSAYAPAIREAVRDQTEAGVELVSDGQVRGDMTEIFASHIPGMTVEDGPAVIGRVEPPRFSPLILDYREATRVAGEGEVKAILTGPVTLCHSLEVRTDLYPSNDHPSLLRDVARALAAEARLLRREGASVLQVDEPVLSTGVIPVEEVARYVNTVLKAFKGGTRVLHVCGDVTGVYFDLEENIDADVFDHEFAGHPGNLEVVAEGNSPIGVGVVRSDTDRVESLDEAVKLLEEAREVLGDRIEFVDPDCGLRKLPREVAKKKLEVVRKARDRVFR
ncbi:methionine synthase [Methanopyrus sp.]